MNLIMVKHPYKAEHKLIYHSLWLSSNVQVRSGNLYAHTHTTHNHLQTHQGSNMLSIRGIWLNGLFTGAQGYQQKPAIMASTYREYTKCTAFDSFYEALCNMIHLL